MIEEQNLFFVTIIVTIHHFDEMFGEATYAK